MEVFSSVWASFSDRSRRGNRFIRENQPLSKPPATIPKCKSRSRSAQMPENRRFCNYSPPSESKRDSDLIRTIRHQITRRGRYSTRYHDMHGYYNRVGIANHQYSPRRRAESGVSALSAPIIVKRTAETEFTKRLASNVLVCAWSLRRTLSWAERLRAVTLKRGASDPCCLWRNA